ncbi:hypothetical protein ACIPRL_08470 [Streptomyces sp. NPDC090085]|uniref:hypothetical protein n=1 Tax=unclassified Streptomyces TaxID=2593676 RepID=UPI00342B1FC8
MPIPPNSARGARLPWWTALSLLCAGCCAALLLRRIAAPPPSRAARRERGRHPLRNDAARHLTTSW